MTITQKFKHSDLSFQLSGFTLIELLVVISIIGILAGLLLVSFTGTQRQARDTQRKNDLRQYQTLLENFANKNNGLYPSITSAAQASTLLCNDLNAEFDPDVVCPEDPKYEPGFGIETAHPPYQYISDGSGVTDATEYALWATLENETNTIWYACSNGRSGTTSSLNVPDSACTGL